MRLNYSWYVCLPPLTWQFPVNSMCPILHHVALRRWACLYVCMHVYMCMYIRECMCGSIHTICAQSTYYVWLRAHILCIYLWGLQSSYSWSMAFWCERTRATRLDPRLHRQALFEIPFFWVSSANWKCTMMSTNSFWGWILDTSENNLCLSSEELEHVKLLIRNCQATFCF